ncbi:ppp4r2 [Pungitius sinensis]
MDIDALSEAFQDFEKTGRKETCPELEQFLCHVAKTGQPMISWSQFKTYFVFKLEKVMDDFHASTPEQRARHNPNVDYVPFEEMKARILKIVDGYNGIPFTIQRLCELLTDPKRNYTGIDKFLMGLEKNVMVVSCVCPTSERNVNGPDTPKPLIRPKSSLTSSLSTNGLPDCAASKEPITEEVEEHRISHSPSAESEITTNSGIKNKHPAEEEEDYETGEHEVKRLKFDDQEDDETESKENESSCEKGPETPQTSEDSCGERYKSGAPCDTRPAAEDHEPSCTRTEPSGRDEDLSETGNVHTVDEDEPRAPSETGTSFEQGNEKSSRSREVEGLPGDKQAPPSASAHDLTAEGDTDSLNSAEIAVEPGEHDRPEGRSAN